MYEIQMGLGALLLVAGSGSLLMFIYGLGSKPKMMRSEPQDTLVLAAHPDDGVIMAGEYCLAAKAKGARVRVAYLTCGSHSSNTEEARTRRKEAQNAWAIAGVPSEDLVFFDLPQSTVPAGPCAASPQDEEGFRSGITEEIRQLKVGSTLFVPALGESHVDHALLRRLALEVVLELERNDLQILEAQEYHPYYSLIRSPWRGLRELLNQVPVVGRVVRGWATAPPGFVQSGPFLHLPVDAERLATKRRMLRVFGSQDQGIMERELSWPDLYRPLSDRASALSTEPSAYCGFWGFSLVTGWVAIGGLATLVPWVSLSALAGRVAGSLGTGIFALGGLFGIALLLMALRNRSQIPKRLIWACTSLGFLLGSWSGLT